jgi:hypothetical protein
MSVQCIVGAVRAVLIAVAVLALMGAAGAQQPKAQPKQPAQQQAPQQQPAQQQAPQPSTNAVALAAQIIIAKGAVQIYDPVIPGLIERARGVFLQQNPMLSRDLNEVAARLRTEFVPRTTELLNDAAKLYATRFSEQELRDVLAFYKSPLGQKVVSEEPAIFDESMKNVDTWAGKFANEVMAKFRAEMKKKGHDL